jgi:hypothetical protein
MWSMSSRERNANQGLPPEKIAERSTTALENADEFPPSEREEIARLAARALRRGADVPGRVQKGPTCGLYALGMVMDYWESRDPASTTVLVQESDDFRTDSHTLSPDTHTMLLEVARERGYTTEGEMFYAAQLAALAREFGYQAVLHEEFTVDTLIAALDRKRPCLAGFDVDDEGNPGEFDGLNAHWAVIESHFEKDGARFLVASHAWSGGEYVWKAEDFMKSAGQLEKGNTEAMPSVPADISTTLKRRLVEVYRDGYIPVKPKRERKKRKVS